MRPGAREAFQRRLPVWQVVLVAPDALSISVASALSVPDAALAPSFPASFTPTTSAESLPSSANVCVPEKRRLPLRVRLRSFGPGEKPGDALDAVSALENGRLMPSAQFASHAMTADFSLAAFLSALRTIASPDLVLPPKTAFAASAPGAALSVAATVRAVPARMVVVRMGHLRSMGMARDRR